MKDRIYVCHTFYHAYVACLKECNFSLEDRGKATLVLSTMSNDFGQLKERAMESGLFEAVLEYEEKEEAFFPELKKYHVDKGNIVFNMISRIKFTKLMGKLQEPFVPVDFKKYKDIYIFCDSDPIGYYLSYKKIKYHAVEDGLNCIKYYDTARYDNRGAFQLKALLSSMNLIFIQNGYGKYCIDMEVNDISALKYPCKKYIEQSRDELVEHLSLEDKRMLVTMFMENIDEVLREIHSAGDEKEKILILTEPLCDLKTRKRIFKDITKEYGEGYIVLMKPHPRDVLDYKKEFPENIVITGKFPMEIMNFIEDLSFRKAISVLTVTNGIQFAQETVFLGGDFMDRYEAPEIHRQNEQI
ncbi:MAG: glycosyltransferase family 52 [Eubacteriales bacterium]